MTKEENKSNAAGSAASDIAQPIVQFPGSAIANEIVSNDPDKSRRRVGILRRHRPKRRVRLSPKFTYTLFVLLPFVLAAYYLFFVAADQYRSVSAFTVRATSGGPQSSILTGILGGSGGGSAGTDPYILREFVRSPALIEKVKSQLDFSSIFTAPKKRNWADLPDFYYSVGKDNSREADVVYWGSMIDVNFDKGTQIITLETRAFDPVTAQRLNQIVVEESVQLINHLSEDSERDALDLARKNVEAMEQKLRSAQKKLLQFRNSQQLITPEIAVTSGSAIIQELTQRRTELAGEIAFLLSELNADAPIIKRKTAQLSIVDEQIVSERSKIGNSNAASAADSNKTVAASISQYEEIALEKKFAEEAYTTALRILETSSANSQKNQRYLAIFQKPTLADSAEYPKRYMLLFVLLISLSLIWAILWLVIVNINSRSR